MAGVMKKLFRGNYALYPSDACEGVCIPLTQNRHTIIDSDSFDMLPLIGWHYRNGYARANMVINGKRTTICIHQIICPNINGLHTDHINGNRCDNRMANLRLANFSQNQGNRKRQSNSESPYKGVIPPRLKHKKWHALVTHNGIRHYLGGFNTAELAAIAYDEAAKKYFGEYARLNFPEMEYNA